MATANISWYGSGYCMATANISWYGTGLMSPVIGLRAVSVSPGALPGHFGQSPKVRVPDHLEQSGD